MEERKEEEVERKLQGEVVQLVGIRGKTVDFVERGMAFNLKLPTFQIMVLQRTVSPILESKPFYWIYRTRQSEVDPWRGVVIAGPFEKEVERKIDLFDKEQKQRWFNQSLNPLDEGIKWVDEINHGGEFSLKVEGGKEVGFAAIWEALELGVERLKEVRSREEQYEREMRRLLPSGGVPGEAARRHEEIGKD